MTNDKTRGKRRKKNVKGSEGKKKRQSRSSCDGGKTEAGIMMKEKGREAFLMREERRKNRPGRCLCWRGRSDGKEGKMMRR